MTDTEINIAIAEACGWKRNKLNPYYWTGPNGETTLVRPMPNYCADLNAMHEAEKTLIEGSDWCGYYFALSNIVGKGEGHINRKLVTASARQRAEAFLRTLGKWKD